MMLSADHQKIWHEKDYFARNSTMNCSPGNERSFSSPDTILYKNKQEVILQLYNDQ